jgi:hypothetical protein
MPYKAEYIWIDGARPTAKLRSKTKILADGAEPPIWGFDGSSTNQAEGHASDRVLKPVASFPDPIRGGDDVLVLCEVFNTDDTPHEYGHAAARTSASASSSETSTHRRSGLSGTHGDCRSDPHSRSHADSYRSTAAGGCYRDGSGRRAWRASRGVVCGKSGRVDAIR